MIRLIRSGQLPFFRFKWYVRNADRWEPSEAARRQSVAANAFLIPHSAFGLLRLGDHILQRGVQIGVGASRAGATRRHCGAGNPIDRRLQQDVHTLGNTRFPGRFITQLGRIGNAGHVTDKTNGIVGRLAIRGAARTGSGTGTGWL